MKTIHIALCVLCLGFGLRAQQPVEPASSGETLKQLSTSAESELSASIQQLNQLRERIASEKLPLAQELTALEEKITTLRRNRDGLARAEAQANLDTAEAKGRVKAGQDELDYVSTLVDEFTRTFESKLNVSELQRSSETIESAKQSITNTALSPSEKFTRQLAAVQLSLKRAAELFGGMRFSGVGVDPQGLVAEGQFALIGPVALFKANGGLAGLVVPQTGSTKPLIRPLEGALQSGLTKLIETGEGTMPFDGSQGGALKALVQKTNLIHIFEKGGPIMWPLLVASILALGTVIERLVFLANERRKRDPAAQEQLFAAVGHGKLDDAARIGKDSRDFVVRTLGYALAHRDTSLPNALVYAQAQELKRFRRGIAVLDTVITLAPLLGLLGTVTGMMGSFSLIGGDLGAPGAITGGIAEALIATAFGLGIAITALLPFNFLNARLDEATHELESASSQLELLVQPSAQREPPSETHKPSGAPHLSATGHAAGRERATAVASGRD